MAQQPQCCGRIAGCNSALPLTPPAANRCRLVKSSTRAAGRFAASQLESQPQSPHRCSIVRQATPTPAAAATQEEKYDVYVHQHEPLQEGEEKHILSVFVADEAGLINRVAGVFARRGANIESLAVGLNIDKALFTIVINGKKSAVANLVKQLSKLVKVRYVEDITEAPRVERELVLFKLAAPPGPARTEVMQLCDIFRGRIIDVSDKWMTVSVTGDPGKTAALQLMLAKFGISEIARTGKISLKRGEQLLEMGGWGDGLLAQRHLNESHANGASAAAQVESPSSTGDANDVYTSSPGPDSDVWTISNVLDAKFDQSEAPKFDAHTLSIVVEDRPGVLNQVTGVFARRGYNVQSLAVGNSEVEGQSRITMVIPGTGQGVSKLITQLNKIVYLQTVTDLSDTPFVARELMLIKVKCDATQRQALANLADIFHGNVCDVSLSTITLEVQGKESKMSALQKLLAPYGILEVARTGRVALARDSGVNTKLLQSYKMGRVML